MLSFSPLNVGIGLIGGAALGGVYFGGLWLSVKKLKNIENKKRFLFFSWIVRSVILCFGLYGLVRYNAAALLCGAVSLLITKSVIVRAVKRKLNEKKERPVC